MMNKKFARTLGFHYIQQVFRVSESLPGPLAARLALTGIMNIQEEGANDSTKRLSEGLKSSRIKHENDREQSPVAFIKLSHQEYTLFTDCLIYPSLLVAREAAKYCSSVRTAISQDKFIEGALDKYRKAVDQGNVERVLFEGSRLRRTLIKSWVWQVILVGDAVVLQDRTLFRRHLTDLLNFDFTHSGIEQLVGEAHEAKEARRYWTERLDSGIDLGWQDVAEIVKLWGHLPYRADLVRRRIKELAEKESNRREIWRGARKVLKSGAVGQFYFAVLLCYENPQVVPESKWRLVWRATEALYTKREKPGFRGLGATNLYSTLLKICVYKLELTEPYQEPWVLYWIASTLASHVCVSIGEWGAQESLELIEKHTEEARLAWTVGSPFVREDILRQSFVVYGSYWEPGIRVALISIANHEIWGRMPQYFSRWIKGSVRRSIAGIQAVSVFDPKRGTIDGLWQLNELQVNYKWAAVLRDSEIDEWMKGLETLDKRSGDGASILELVKQLCKSEEVEQLAIGAKLVGYLRAGHIKASQLLDTDFGVEDIRCVDQRYRTGWVEQLLLAAINQSQRWEPEEAIRFTHWAARELIRCTEEEEELRSEFFLALVIGSIKFGFISALLRILNRSDGVISQGARYKVARILMDLQQAAPNWVNVRVRPVVLYLAS